MSGSVTAVWPPAGSPQRGGTTRPRPARARRALKSRGNASPPRSIWPAGSVSATPRPRPHRRPRCPPPTVSWPCQWPGLKEMSVAIPPGCRGRSRKGASTGRRMRSTGWRGNSLSCRWPTGCSCRTGFSWQAMIPQPALSSGGPVSAATRRARTTGLATRCGRWPMPSGRTCGGSGRPALRSRASRSPMARSPGSCPPRPSGNSCPICFPRMATRSWSAPRGRWRRCISYRS